MRRPHKPRKPGTVTTRATCPACAKTLPDATLPTACPRCQARLQPGALAPAFEADAVVRPIAELAAGTRIRLASGDYATVDRITPCGARVILERKRVREFDAIDPRTGESRHVIAASEVTRSLAPSAEVQVA